MVLHEGKKTVRRGATDDFQPAGVLEPAKRCNQILAESIGIDLPALSQPALIQSRQVLDVGCLSGSLDLALCQSNSSIEVAEITLPQKPIVQHRAQGWRQRHRQPKRGLISHQPLQHLPDRDVRFRYGFEKPSFLKKFGMFGVSNKGQVSV